MPAYFHYDPQSDSVSRNNIFGLNIFMFSTHKGIQYYPG